MNRRDVLKSYAGIAFGYTFLNEKAWGDGRYPILQEISTHFSIRVNGHPFVVNHAAESYSYANFAIDKPADIVLTALTPGF